MNNPPCQSPYNSSCEWGSFHHHHHHLGGGEEVINSSLPKLLYSYSKQYSE